MTKQVINLGAAVNDGTGDPIRTALSKVNANFKELYDLLSNQANGVDLKQIPFLDATSIFSGEIKNKNRITLLNDNTHSEVFDSPDLVWSNPNDGAGSTVFADLYKNFLRFYGSYQGSSYKTSLQLDVSTGNAMFGGDVFSNTYSKTENGYTRLLNGFIFCWGTGSSTFSSNGGTPFNATFPISFPNVCLTAWAGASGNSGTTVMNVEGVSNGGCSGFGRSTISTSAVTTPFRFFAIGY